MRIYKDSVHHNQSILMPRSIAEDIPENSLARLIVDYSNSVNFGILGFKNTDSQAVGRPAYDPRLLFRLLLWGMLNGVRSSRALEKACIINIEARWLVQEYRPHFTSIASFLANNGNAFEEAAKAFVAAVIKRMPSKGTIAIDSTKIKAASSRKNIRMSKTLEKDIQTAKEKIRDYRKDIEERDRLEDIEPPDMPMSDEDYNETLEHLKSQVKTKEAELEALKNANKDSTVLGEGDAAIVGKPQEVKYAGYSLQTAVDSETHMIVAHTVVAVANDFQQLFNIAGAAQQALGGVAIAVVADKGYSSGVEIEKCEKAGITVSCPSRHVPSAGVDRYHISDYVYDAATNSYTCPAGKKLHYTSTGEKRREDRYSLKKEICAACPLKRQCLGEAKRFAPKLLTRPHGRASAELSNERWIKDPGLAVLRRSTVEHPYATIKRRSGARFMTKGLQKVKGEAALMVLGYNMLRALNHFGMPKMQEIFG